MLLKYRGGTYEINPASQLSDSGTIRVVEWEVGEKYRWVSFQYKHWIAVIAPFNHHLKYRGVTY